MNPSDPDFPSDPAGPPLPDADDKLLLLWAALGARADLGPVIAERFAQQRRRLAKKIAARSQASRALLTTRYAPSAMARANARARLQTLYLPAANRALRPGEPLNVLLIELAPEGSLQLDAAAPGVLREWLLVRGGVRLASAGEPPLTLAPLDYHTGSVDAYEPHERVAPTRLEADAQGALLFLRESRLPPSGAPQAAQTVRDAHTSWKPYASNVERRVLWRHGGLAALLYRAAPGASVPPHEHGHDEECLVLRGETFQEDVLLREGDYQLAPAGSVHASGSSEAGSIFYIHGDLDLMPRAPDQRA